MARQSYTAQALVRSGNGLAGTERDGHADGHSVVNDGHVIAVLRNSGAGSHTTTIQTPGTIDGLALADLTVVVAAGATKYVGPFPKGVYNQADGALYVDFDGTVAEMKVTYINVPIA